MPIYFGESRSTPVKILATGSSTVKAADASEMSTPSAVEKIGVGSASAVETDKLPTGSGEAGLKTNQGYYSGTGGYSNMAPFSPGEILEVSTFRDNVHGNTDGDKTR